MGGCFIILVFLLILGAAIWLVELVVRTPALAIAIAVIAVLAFVGWVRSLNTPARSLNTPARSRGARKPCVCATHKGGSSG